MEIITNSKIKIQGTQQKLENTEDILFLVDELENNKGMFLSSGTEYPGRYSRWETGFSNPPVEILGYSNHVIFKALNKRGEAVVSIFEKILEKSEDSCKINKIKNSLRIDIINQNKVFSEEERSKQPSILTPIRVLLEALKFEGKDPLGFYGAFGFDMLFQFEKIKLINKRNPDTPILRLFFPDKIYTYDRKKEEGFCFSYDFSFENISTKDIDRDFIASQKAADKIKIEGEIQSDLSDEQYSALVNKAKEKMLVGEVFELVLRRRYHAKYFGSSSLLFKKMIDINPSPYQFFCQFKDEQLIGTSPEMFVRVTDDRVETCPISGTIKRSGDVIEDEKRIKQLLNSYKDEVELTMCTDVDRSDKSRVCKAGSIRLLGRRQIEKYKGLFHTVDHVEGILREDCSAIDAFLSHMWAVTLMGSPKSSAAKLIEEYENEPRDYYGGAVGAMFLNGNMNTGITIRTIHLKDNCANYSVGASLVFDSVGEDEALETRTKATSFFNIFKPKEEAVKEEKELIGSGLKVIVIDNEDSFVNTLSDYFRQEGCEVITYRRGVDIEVILSQEPDLILHSPGPKLPKDFNMHPLIKKFGELNIPQFGVCLGLQGIAETFGGSLKKIDPPRQGKKWSVSHNQKGIFEGIKSPISAGAYHSWVADENNIPNDIEIMALCEGGYVMALQHKQKPVWGVQFHPESIMSSENNFGHRLIKNVIRLSKEHKIEKYSK